MPPEDYTKPEYSIFLFVKALKAVVTYDKAQRIYKKRHGKTVKTCWIADVKRQHGKTKRKSWNRISAKPKYPCPDHVFSNLEKILYELYMI